LRGNKNFRKCPLCKTPFNRHDISASIDFRGITDAINLHFGSILEDEPINDEEFVFSKFDPLSVKARDSTKLSTCISINPLSCSSETTKFRNLPLKEKKRLGEKYTILPTGLNGYDMVLFWLTRMI